MVLAPIALAPWLLGFAGVLYGVVAGVGGARHGGWRVRVKRLARGAAGRRAARRLFAFSILYLFLLFAVLLVERLVRADLGGFCEANR